MSALTKTPRRGLWVIGGLAAVLLTVLGAALLLRPTPSEAQDAQPFVFNHQIHVQENGISCVYCHSGVMRSPTAGIPSMQLCAGCHAPADGSLGRPGGGIDNGSEALATLRAYIANGTAILWERITFLPRYAYFAHHVHIKAGASCETCHGNVGEMEAVYQAEKINMGWCLSCHQREPNALELMDCSICHR